jgi:hypothetical protein
MVCQKQRILSNWVTSSWPSNSSIHVLIHSVGKSIPHPISTKTVDTQAEAQASLSKFSSNICFYITAPKMNLLLVWTLPPQNSFLHKIIDVNLPNFTTIETLQRGIVPGGMKGHESKLQIHELSVPFVWPWNSNLVLVSTTNNLHQVVQEKRRLVHHRYKAETWLAPLLHLDLEWRMLHLLKRA